MNALKTGRAVQAGCGFVKEHYGRIADQFKGNREPLFLTAGQISSHRISVLAQAESKQNVIDLEEGVKQVISTFKIKPNTQDCRIKLSTGLATYD